MKFNLTKAALMFKRAAEAARAAETPDDGGTCNLDTPAFFWHGARQADIEAAAEAADLTVTSIRWMGKRAFWLNVPLKGQGNCRSRMMEAAQRVLNDERDSFPGFEPCGYYQMD